MKKKIVWLFSIVLSIFLGVFIGTNNKNKSYDKNESTIKKSDTISMMLETEANSKKYEMTTRNEWPTSEYKFNSKLSKCENGSSLSWDYQNRNVVMEGTTSDKCYIYFDKVVTVSDYCSSGNNLAECIKTFGNAGYDKSNIYIHNESLKYGANDNSYRFAGSSDYVNNYVCFGSNEEVCPSDNLYRIIGVFDGQVKLIKADYATSDALGTNGEYFASNDYDKYDKYIYYKGDLTRFNWYYWSKENAQNDWEQSKLNTINLNTNYLNSLTTFWSDMIDTTDWVIGGFNGTRNDTINTFYQNEIVNSFENKTYSSKIGLMYISEYFYATDASFWGKKAYISNDESEYYKSLRSNNWMYLGLWEWTITKSKNYDGYIYGIAYYGYLDSNTVTTGDAVVRPTFSLLSSITYNGGSGTKESPIRVVMTLSEYVKSKYTSQGDNNLYYHNGTIKSGDTVIDANDGSYRYAGSSDTTNNYVCFGSDVDVCPTDNLYRIIGVFGDQVKLIKADFATSDALGEDGAYNGTGSASNYSNYLGSLSTLYWYYWNNSTNTNTWSESNLNTINLNTNYLNNLESWANMIVESTWKVGGNTYANIETSPMYSAYQNEIVNPISTTYNAKIGLMYVSDYGYATIPDYWTYVGYDVGNSLDYRVAKENNWMYLGVIEWTITRGSEYTDTAFSIISDGSINSHFVNNHHLAIRPVFYLKSSAIYASGSGIITSPIRLF